MNVHRLLITFCSCLDDVDDEVRDRAALYLKVYEDPPLMNTYVKEGSVVRFTSLRQRSYRCTESIFSLAALESKLVSYISDPESLDKPFDTSSIPKVSKEQAAKESARECQVRTYSWVR